MKNKIVIIEGSQGVGKGTITNILREHMPYTNLLRLSGIEDKSMDGKAKVVQLRQAEINMMMASRDCDLNFILDRSHLSESVYCKLGYKGYNFEQESDILNEQLNYLTKYYEVHLIVLTTGREEYLMRLIRDKPTFTDISFNADNSMMQQEAYVVELNHIMRKYPDINCYQVSTTNRDPYDIAYDIREALLI